MSEETKGNGARLEGEPEQEGGRMLWIVVAALVVLGGIYFLSGPGQPAADQPADDGNDPIHLGVIAPLTGDGAAYGEVMRASYDLAVKEINESGGVGGRTIELSYEDGKCDSKSAGTAAQQLLSVEGVRVILGGTCSGETLSAAELTQEARAILLSPSSTSPDITGAGDLVFRTYPSDSVEGALMARYAEDELGAETAAIISEKTDFAQGVRQAFSESFGGELVFDETFDSDETDFRTLVAKMRRERPDIVYVIPQTPATGEPIIKQMQEEGVGGTWFGANAIFNRDAFSDDPRLYRDMVFAEVRLSDEREKTDAFLDAFEEEYGESPGFDTFAASAYDDVYLVAEAVAKVGVDPDKIRDYFLEEVDGWEGALGELSFDENGDVELELGLVKVDRRGNTQPIEL